MPASMYLVAHLTTFEMPSMTVAFAAGIAVGFGLAWKLARR